MPNLGTGPDLGAVGSAAVGSKRASSGGQTLTSFSVKKGDNGGVLVCETYEKTPPAGRRQGAAYPGGGDYKENPFSPDDGAAASSHVAGLLSQMGITAAAEPAAPDVAAVQGPRGAAVAVGGPLEAPGEYGY